MKILIAEDDPLLQELTKMIEGWGYEFDLVSDGQAGYIDPLEGYSLKSRW